VDIIQHKARLRHYFDGVGFARWSAIYGDSELSTVRRAIRVGHERMLDRANSWLDERGLPRGATALDAGCGTGLFSLALARRGLQVDAVDLAPQMAQATAAKAASAGLADLVQARASDLDDVRGSYDLVVCFDVLIHYPAELFGGMLAHLAGMSRGTMLFTYAPHSPILAALHKVGGYFPQSQRRTEIQMIRDTLVRQTLETAGMRLRRAERVGKSFYHVTLVEATREG
jgi:magnesium-protoporphyrin O-methyltransferase